MSSVPVIKFVRIGWPPVSVYEIPGTDEKEELTSARNLAAWCIEIKYQPGLAMGVIDFLKYGINNKWGPMNSDRILAAI